MLDSQPPAYAEQERAGILSAHVHEQLSTRVATHLLGVAYNTLAGWLGKTAEVPALKDTLLPAQAGDVRLGG